MTNAVKADHVADGNGVDGFPGSVPNPYVKQVIGAGRLIQLDLDMHLICYMKDIRCHYLLWKMDWRN